MFRKNILINGISQSKITKNQEDLMFRRFCSFVRIFAKAYT